jgi:membrane-associated phospholipid phosphatase
MPTLVYYLILGFYFEPQVQYPWLLYFLGMMLIATCLLPATSIYILYKYGMISDVNLIAREDRLLPNVVVTSTYMITYLMLKYVNHLNGIIVVPLFLMTISLVINGVVSFYWKISAHATAVAGVLGFWGFMQVIMPVEYLYYPFLILIILTGALFSARLYLGRHTPAQVWAGGLLGLAVSILGAWMYFFDII